MKTDRTDTAAVEALADSIAHTFDRDDDGRGWVFDSAQLAEFARRLTATQPGAAVPEVMEDRVIVAAKAISAIRQGSDRAFRMYLDDARAALLAAAPAPEGSALKLGACGVLPSSSLIDSLKTTEALRTLCHQLNAERRKITAAIDPDSAPSSPAPRPCPDMSKSWPERDYMCECSQCGSQFIGAKRQAVCKACAPAPSESLDESLLRTIREIAPAVGGEVVGKELFREAIAEAMKRWPEASSAILFLTGAVGPTSPITADDIKWAHGQLATVPAPAAAEAGGVEALARLIADDAHAISYQSMAQYRGALLREACRLASAPQPAGSEQQGDSARIDFIERTFSGMTNRERYLPVTMIWGKGANGRTLREACDKYMARDAGKGEGVGDA